MGKTVFVILDACRFDKCTEYAGVLEHYAEVGKAAKYRVKGELPSISRSMYATLLTGLPSSEHGILTNTKVKRMEHENIFSLCRANGKVTGAAAYFWMSHLYNKESFDILEDRYQFNAGGLIDYGIFYQEDIYPDSHLISDGEFIRTHYNPDFLLIHSMNIDLMGHRFGADSREYKDAVANASDIVGSLTSKWLEAGYNVIITADHGMDELGIHGGSREEHRYVPLYLFGDIFEYGKFDEFEISQLNIAPLICKSLGIRPGDKMLKELAIKFK